MDPQLGVNVLGFGLEGQAGTKAGLQMQPFSLLPDWNVCECNERKERKIKKENPRWCFSRYLLEMFKLAEYA